MPASSSGPSEELVALELIRRAVAENTHVLTRALLSGRNAEPGYIPRPVHPGNPAVVMTPAGVGLDPNRVINRPAPAAPDPKKLTTFDLLRMQQDAARDLRDAAKAEKEAALAAKLAGRPRETFGGNLAAAMGKLFGAVTPKLAQLNAVLSQTTSGFDLVNRTQQLFLAVLAPVLLPALFLFAAGMLYLTDLVMNKLWKAFEKLWGVVGPGLREAFDKLSYVVNGLTGKFQELFDWVNRQLGGGGPAGSTGPAENMPWLGPTAQAARRGLTPEQEAAEIKRDADTYQKNLIAGNEANFPPLKPGATAAEVGKRVKELDERLDYYRSKAPPGATPEPFVRDLELRRQALVEPPTPGGDAKAAGGRLTAIDERMADAARRAGLPSLNFESPHKEFADLWKQVQGRPEGDPQKRAAADLGRAIQDRNKFLAPFTGPGGVSEAQARHQIRTEGRLPEFKEPAAGEPSGPGLGSAIAQGFRQAKAAQPAAPGRPEPSFKQAMLDMLKVFQLSFGPKASFGEIGASQVERAQLAALNQDPLQERMLKAVNFCASLLTQLIGNTEPNADHTFGGR